MIDLRQNEDIYRITAEIGYWIPVPMWGKGIATSAITEITKWAFENLPDLHKIIALVYEFNIGSMQSGIQKRSRNRAVCRKKQ